MAISMTERKRCTKGHLLPVLSTGYRLCEPVVQDQSITWWLPHEATNALLRVVPHLPQATEMVEYWTCTLCGGAITSGEAITLAMWRATQAI